MKKNYSISDGVACIKINKNIYTKEVLTQASYVKLDKFYFLIDEEDNNYLIFMKAKDKNEKSDLEVGIFEFFDELIESKSYLDQLKRTSEIRQTILEKALISQHKEEE